VAAANKFNADFYLSIHHNAGINGGAGGGICSFAYTRASKASYEWQDELYDELIAKTGLKGNRYNPKPTANFYEIKYTNMPAVLLELGFMDSTVDTPIILTNEFATQCAEACVNVIVKKAGLKKKTEPVPTPAPITTKILRKGSVGEGVEHLQNLLNLLGYSCGDSDGDFGGKTYAAVIKFQ